MQWLKDNKRWLIAIFVTLAIGFGSGFGTGCSCGSKSGFAEGYTKAKDDIKCDGGSHWTPWQDQKK